MTTLIPDTAGTLRDATMLLRMQLRALANEPAPPATRIVRLEVTVEQVDPLLWLHAQPHPAKIFWSERHTGCEVAAVGEADLLTSQQTHTDMHTVAGTLQQRLATAPADVRYYGGFRFDQRQDADLTWQRFGAYRFVLPQWELRRDGSRTTLAWNIVVQPGTVVNMEQATRALQALNLRPLQQPSPFARPRTRTDLPDRNGWRHNIETALRLFDTGTLQKIVLARKAVFQFDTTLDPLALLERLKAVTPNSFHFCFQPEGGLAFIGATPERLYGRTGRTLHSEAIAGTRPNGATPAATARLGDELLHSEKEVREHVFVREHIGQRLAPLCRRLDVAPQPALLKLTRRQHLWTPIEGMLRAGVTDAELVSCLHPTSAVGGEPTDRAFQYIAELEPFDRGWYAGPLGWIARDSAEFAVAIRSGVIDGAQLALYSGAGIVPGSTLQGEWDEIENKISDFVNLLTVER